MPKNIIIVGDFARDLDDEHTLVLAAGLQKAGLIKLCGVIGNLLPAKERAKVAKGTLNELGLSNVPVGIGSDVVKSADIHEYEVGSVPYIASEEELFPWDNALHSFLTGYSLNDEKVTLVLQSGLTDAVELLRDDEYLFQGVVEEVVIMGGIQAQGDDVMLTGKYMQSDDAHNVTYDWPSGAWLYAKLQELGIPMIITTRNTAYACQIPFSIYDEMEKTGNPVGKCLKDRQKPSLEALWTAACAPEDASIRGTLPPRCNREWFIDTFCDSKDPGDNIHEIWPYTGKFNLYDPMNLLVAVPELRKEYFQATEVSVLGTRHLIVGVSPKNNGIKNVDLLREFIVNTELSGLTI